MHPDADGLLWTFAYIPLDCSNNLRAWALRWESLIVSGTQLLPGTNVYCMNLFDISFVFLTSVHQELMIIFGGDRMMLPVLLRTNAERAAVQAILKNPDGYLFCFTLNFADHHIYI
jgi:hypothetical protein